MDWGVKKNFRYITAIIFFFFLIPHFVMCLPEFSELNPENWTAARGFITARIYWYTVWIGVPLSGSVIALIHVLRGGEFCPALILTAAAAMLSYLFRIEVSLVIVLSVSVILMILIESFAILGHYGREGAQGKTPRLLAGAAANYKFLALLSFWSVAAIRAVYKRLHADRETGC